VALVLVYADPAWVRNAESGCRGLRFIGSSGAKSGSLVAFPEFVPREQERGG
jgi:hypothetical protein